MPYSTTKSAFFAATWHHKEAIDKQRQHELEKNRLAFEQELHCVPKKHPRHFQLYLENQLSLPCLAFGVGRLLHLPSAEAVSVRPNARPQK